MSNLFKVKRGATVPTSDVLSAYELGFMTEGGKLYIGLGDSVKMLAAGPSSTLPKAAGNASAGVEDTFARGDHIHPLQTTISGNAGTATKLKTARTIQTNLASTSSVSFDGSADITPGVKGILPITNGGTGANTAISAISSLVCRGTFTGDFDTAIDIGLYWVNLSACTNGPAESGYGYLEILRSAADSSSKMQRFTFYHNGEALTRTYVNNQWYSWFNLARSVDGWPTARCKLLNTRSGGWSSGASVSIPELANCDAALVLYGANTAWSTKPLKSVVIPVGKTGVLDCIVNMTNATVPVIIQRQLTIGSDGTVASGEVWLKSTTSNTSASDSTSYPYACSPYKIYGLKF